MTESVSTCWHCRQPLRAVDFAREALCPSCGKHTHVCRNCRFYQPGISNACQEPIADYVADKTRANFCDYFTPAPPAGEDGAATSSEQDLLAAAQALFQDKDD